MMPSMAVPERPEPSLDITGSEFEIPEDGFDALKRFAPEIAENLEKQDKAFARKFRSVRTDDKRKVLIEDYYSTNRFRKLAEALLALDPVWARGHYREWLQSLLMRDYRQMYDLLEPASVIKRNPDGIPKREPIHRKNKIALRRNYYCWKLAKELLAEADRRCKFRAAVNDLQELGDLPAVGISQVDKGGTAEGGVGTKAKTYPTPLARNIDRFRKECGWSYEHLAKVIDVNKKTIIAHIKKGSRPRPDTLGTYAQAFSDALKQSITVNQLENP